MLSDAPYARPSAGPPVADRLLTRAFRLDPLARTGGPDEHSDANCNGIQYNQSLIGTKSEQKIPRHRFVRVLAVARETEKRRPEIGRAGVSQAHRRSSRGLGVLTRSECNARTALRLKPASALANSRFVAVRNTAGRLRRALHSPGQPRFDGREAFSTSEAMLARLIALSTKDQSG